MVFESFRVLYLVETSILLFSCESLRCIINSFVERQNFWFIMLSYTSRHKGLWADLFCFFGKILFLLSVTPTQYISGMLSCHGFWPTICHISWRLLLLENQIMVSEKWEENKIEGSLTGWRCLPVECNTHAQFNQYRFLTCLTLYLDEDDSSCTSYYRFYFVFCCFSSWCTLLKFWENNRKGLGEKVNWIWLWLVEF